MLHSTEQIKEKRPTAYLRCCQLRIVYTWWFTVATPERQKRNGKKIKSDLVEIDTLEAGSLSEESFL